MNPAKQVDESIELAILFLSTYLVEKWRWLTLNANITHPYNTDSATARDKAERQHQTSAALLSDPDTDAMRWQRQACFGTTSSGYSGSFHVPRSSDPNRAASLSKRSAKNSQNTQ